MSKNLFTETGRYTSEAVVLEAEVTTALAPIFKKYLDQGYSSREIEYIASAASSDIALEARLGIVPEVKSSSPTSEEEKRSKFSQTSPGVGKRKNDI